MNRFHRPGRRPLASLVLALAGVSLVLAACGPPAGFLSAADVAREVEEARATIPLPPGATFPPYSPPDPNAAYEPGHGRFVVENQAQCAWFRYWAEAIVRNDQAAIERASAMWEEMQGWSVFSHTDAAGRAHLESIVERARLGDPSGLLQEVKLGCS